MVEVSSGLACSASRQRLKPGGQEPPAHFEGGASSLRVVGMYVCVSEGGSLSHQWRLISS